MDPNAAAHDAAGGVFFDLTARLDGRDEFEACSEPTPTGWSRSDWGFFVSYTPRASELPDQGWKIHVSSTPEDASHVLAEVTGYCLKYGITFKFIKSRAGLVACNSKYWDRSGSGKFITLYPRDDDEFSRALAELDVRLEGARGPYILSDVRYRNGPLYCRYGAFKLVWAPTDQGDPTPAIRNAAGDLLPDIRDVIFTYPDFATPPSILTPYLTRRSDPIEDCRFEFNSALHFSNGGGVYLGRDTLTLAPVAIKEARPFAALDDRGNDAVARLRNEYIVLQQLQGLEGIPKLVSSFSLWEHEFIAMEYIPGSSLFMQVLYRYPLVHPYPGRQTLTEYLDWADDKYTQLSVIVDGCHDRGIALVDLHPSNVIVRPTGRVVLIDFECSTTLSDQRPAPLGAPGFIGPVGLSRQESDRFALARIRLMMLMPVIPVLRLNPEKAATLAEAACECFDLSPTRRTSLEKDLEATKTATYGPDRAAGKFLGERFDWSSVKELLVLGIHEHASPDRDDSLFPGDSLQFAYGGATLGYGAAGIALAMSRLGQELPKYMTEWFSCHGRRPANHKGTGLYDGLHGVAYALLACGERELACETFEQALKETVPDSPGLFGGRAGIALNLLLFGRETNNDHLVDLGLDIGRQLRAETALRRSDWEALTPGLMTGATGVALLFIRIFEMTGQRGYLDAAEEALRFDLQYGQGLDDGSYHLHLGSKFLPYLDRGSIGVALVIARFLQHRSHVEFSTILTRVRRTCHVKFVYQPGLFEGRASFISMLAESTDPNDRSIGAVQVRRLGWHACEFGGHLMFPGRGLTRYSFDLATGTAGILMAAQAIEDGNPIGLPFL